jgi:hypothetical protein
MSTEIDAYRIFKVDEATVFAIGLDKPLEHQKSSYRELGKFGNSMFEDGVSQSLLLAWNEYLIILHPQSYGIHMTGRGLWARAIIAKKEGT